MHVRENFSSSKKQYFDSVLDTYKTMVCQAITNYQAEKFGTPTPIVMKKELLRKFRVSADLARKIVDGPLTDTSTMMIALDIMENILSLYDPGWQLPDREAQFKRKLYFYRKYVVDLDMEKPIVQNGTPKEKP
ncbi:MAG: hypothetical protein IKH95_11035 [Bacteroidaceae bacterium]|nr:hypothetical protein [Bacteroidaceae bacterium]